MSRTWSTSTSIPLILIATRDTPTGTTAGLRRRRRGAATRRNWAAREHGKDSSRGRQHWSSITMKVMPQGLFTIVVPDSPTGFMVGRTRKRTGVARTSIRAARHTTVTVSPTTGPVNTANGVAETSRRDALLPLSRLWAAMHLALSTATPPHAKSVLTGRRRTPLSDATMRVHWPTARCRWSVMFAAPAASRQLGARWRTVPPAIPTTAMRHWPTSSGLGHPQRSSGAATTRAKAVRVSTHHRWIRALA
mmetsp:Transcript_77249/g.107367  ORF Transcript_77249/g.107367 Transcript_77249/m.107367 type:complete len:249 (+) Transcript_77249:442-1188(+)